MRVDWSRWRGLGVTGRVSPRFAHLCGPASVGHAPSANGSLPGREAILAAEPGDRPELLGAMLRDKVARVLGTSPDRLDGDKPLLQLGIDSLMAIELRNWLEGQLQVDLPIVELMRSPGVSGLAELLVERLEAGGKPPAHEPGPNGATNSHHGPNGHATLPVPAAPAELLSRVDELPDDQVDVLLAALLDETSPGTAC